jgi:4-amino-4-deoxy-L-arabinose transferase-like glycosyltransferase
MMIKAQLLRLRGFLFLLGFTTALLAAFVLWRQQSFTAHTPDPFGLSEIGSNVANGRGFVQNIQTAVGPVPFRTRRAPMYPTLIAAIYSVGGEKPALVQLAQCVMAGLICVLIFEIGRLLFNPRAGLISAILYAFHPMVLRYVPDLQVEVTLAFLYTLAAWRSVHFLKSPSTLNGALFGAAAAAAALTKPVGLPYAGLFAFAYLLTSYLAKRRSGNGSWALPLPGLAAIFVAMAVLILPWTYRNYRVFGQHVVLISSNAGGEFLRGYIYTEPDYYLLRKGATTDAELRANQWEAELFASQGKVWEQNELETELVLNREAKAKLLSEPLAFLRKMFVNFFMFWYVATTKANSLFVGFIAVCSWALAVVGMRRARTEARPFWPVLLPILSVNLTYAALLALARYSAPTIPLLMVLAGLGVETLLRRWLPSIEIVEPNRVQRTA